MSKKEFKQYGRTKVNKLDWLLAYAFCFLAIGSIIISICISTKNAFDRVGPSFKTFINGIIFNYNFDLGFTAALSIITSILFYGFLLFLIIGFILLKKNNQKDRIPGLFATLLAINIMIIFLAFATEFLKGGYRKQLNVIWSISLIIVSACLFILSVASIYLSVNFKADIELKNQKKPEIKAISEEKVENLPEESIKEESISNEDNAVIVDNPEEEATDNVKGLEDAVDQGKDKESTNPFDSMGKRHKFVPFESKMKRSKPEIQQRYKEIVAALDKYDLNDRISIPGETFSYKKERLILITFSGQTLKVYFKISPKHFKDSTIPVKDASKVRKYKDIPSCLVIKSDLASRRAISIAQEIIKRKRIPRK